MSPTPFATSFGPTGLNELHFGQDVYAEDAMANSNDQSKDELSATTIQAVYTSFLDTLKSLHVDPRVLEAARKAVASRNRELHSSSRPGAQHA